ncbi:MAG: DUF3164 family protein [Deltaproteobacteria bacterium]|nr:DUF3164 family protein [Deltaproteobacteria bacterium]
MEGVMNGYMKDAQGRLVPESMVSEIDKSRHDLVMEIVEKTKALAGELAEFKARVLGDIQAFVELSAERFDTTIGGVKGNVMLTSFDGEYRVIRAVSDYLVFDERLQVAKALIDECIQDWSEGSRDEIKALVNDAFYVDKQGKINTQRILGLRRLAITDPKWKRAMDAIGESVQVAGSRTYVRIYRRDRDGNYQHMNLDLAGV